jgi:hypothetical protein
MRKVLFLLFPLLPFALYAQPEVPTVHISRKQLFIEKSTTIIFCGDIRVINPCRIVVKEIPEIFFKHHIDTLGAGYLKRLTWGLDPASRPKRSKFEII